MKSEVNNITKQLQTQSLDLSQTDTTMFTQPRAPNNKSKAAIEKFCSYCHRTNHSIFACLKNQRDDEEKRDAHAESKSPQKSFVKRFRSPSNNRTNRHNTRHSDHSYMSNSKYITQ